ncbi:hypothetical protein [Planotetraspora sp. GP83]|uniref:hypothetical protein n=1 Tax=Planotetraspora sp. GP83 TaxID=3156264 RepID=UPI0035192703
MLIGTRGLVSAQRASGRDEMLGHQVGEVVGERTQLGARLTVQLIGRDVCLELGQFLALPRLLRSAISRPAARLLVSAEGPRAPSVLTVAEGTLRALALPRLALRSPEGSRTTVVVTVGTTAFSAAETACVTGTAPLVTAAVLEGPSTAVVAVARAVPPTETAATLTRRPATTVVPIARAVGTTRPIAVTERSR